jgi:outer membrane protein assembly factor BamB
LAALVGLNMPWVFAGETEPVNWSSFRGPGGTGVSPFADVPTEWNEEKKLNILWKSPVKLPGFSSPVVWEGRIFLSAASRKDRVVFCYDADSGALLWTGTYTSSPDAPADYAVWEDREADMHAVCTPAVSGHGVFALFANGELAAFDHDGKLKWSKLVADSSENMYGLGSSILTWRDRVIVPLDGEKGYLYAFKAADGKLAWKRKRPDLTWASPILLPASSGREQVVVSGDPMLSGWDPDSGKLLWHAEFLSGDVAPSPVFHRKRIIAVHGDTGMFAVKPGGTGNVTKTHVTWSTEGDDLDGMLPCTTSPLGVGEQIYTFEGNSFICVDAGTGKKVFEKELEVEANYASPAAVGDKILLFAGKETLIVRAGSTFKLLARCPLKERVDACPAFMKGRIVLRGSGHLYCIGDQ